MSYQTYAGIQKASETSRDLEIRTISYITRQLADANTPDANPMSRIRALNGNVRLWSLMIEDLSDPGNALPDTLKASYISLGLFARRASLAALSTARDLSTLIRLNTDVLEALDHQRQAVAA
jgi:flagellar protein FlaF